MTTAKSYLTDRPNTLSPSQTLELMMIYDSYKRRTWNDVFKRISSYR